MSRPVPLRHAGRPVDATLAVRDRTARLDREGERFEARLAREGPWIEIVSERGAVRAATARDARGLWVALEGRTYLFEVEHRVGAGEEAPEERGEVRAPMTGRVVSVEAKPGARVREGDLLLTIEAMKMEFKVAAPADAAIAEVRCTPGDRVDLGQTLVRLAPENEGAPPTSRGGEPA